LENNVSTDPKVGAEPLYLSYQRGGLNLLPLNILAKMSNLISSDIEQKIVNIQLKCENVSAV
jgi:hypothetical protein